MKNEFEKKKYRICGFVGIDPNTDSFKWISDELDELLGLFHQEQIKLIEEVEKELEYAFIECPGNMFESGTNHGIGLSLDKLEDLKQTL